MEQSDWSVCYNHGTSIIVVTDIPNASIHVTAPSTLVPTVDQLIQWHIYSMYHTLIPYISIALSPGSPPLRLIWPIFIVCLRVRGGELGLF